MSLDNFTYHFRLPPSATLVDLNETYPEGGDLTFELERKGFTVRTLLQTEFRATGADYNALEAIRAADPCDDVEFVLQLSGVEVWAGQLNLRKAKWFPDQCRVEFNADVKDDYNCVYSNWETEKNILTNTRRTVEPFFGTISESSCTVDDSSINTSEEYARLSVSACLDDVDTYAIKQFTITEEGAPGNYRHVVTWVSERVTLPCVGGSPDPPPGDGWTLVDNDCAGSGNATYARRPDMAYDGEYSATTGIEYDARWIVVGQDAGSYTTGVLLSDVLDQFAGDCSLAVKSDFFGINAPGTAPANSAYTASSALHSLMVFQKSDIKRPDATNPATSAYVKLKDLLQILQDMFQVYWRLEDAGATIRLEHISYFDGSNGDDLTATQPDTIEARNSFTFDTDKIAPRDEFAWMDDTLDDDFRGRPIIYPDSCADQTLEPRNISVRQVFTNLGKCINDADNVSDEGLFFMATDLLSGTYYINRETGVFSTLVKANMHLAWSNLHENYHTWGRPLPSGTLNEVSQTFNSYQRSKRQEAITARYTPSAFFALDLTDKLKTDLGWGEIDRATYSARSCGLTVELLHDD